MLQMQHFIWGIFHIITKEGGHLFPCVLKSFFRNGAWFGGREKKKEFHFLLIDWAKKSYENTCQLPSTWLHELSGSQSVDPGNLSTTWELIKKTNTCLVLTHDLMN